MTLYAGIDCGTQSTKVIIADNRTARILGEGSAPHPMISESDGSREQEAVWWTDALETAFAQAIKNAGIDGRDIRALAVSGQQHGFVPVSHDGTVLAPAKLWCDTSTSAENQWFIDALGGEQAALDRLGVLPQTGCTVSKIIRFKQQHPELWKQLRYVLLPHDYLNFWLTGQACAEYGDASDRSCSISVPVSGIRPPLILSIRKAAYGRRCRRWCAQSKSSARFVRRSRRSSVFPGNPRGIRRRR